MAVINPRHLLDQADKLIGSPAAGPPRQADLCRAISAAYNGVFHYIVTVVADEFVGVTKRNGGSYTLVYRSIDHRALRDLCNEAKKQQLTAKYQKYAPSNGFGSDIQAFAYAVVELQEGRHSADYDPSIRFKTLDGRVAIATARSAIQRFQSAARSRQTAFAALLLFPPR